MGLLTKPALEELISRGCSCGEKKLEFRTYVDGRFGLLAGEPVKGVVWAYKGETFVDGVFEVTCVGCKKTLFASDVCPRCNAPGALDGVLDAPNAFAVPKTCPRCDAETLSYIAMLPARVTYEGVRAQKARPSVEMEDLGFHGCRVDCKACGVVAQVTSRCPLCAAPGPLRARPD